MALPFFTLQELLEAAREALEVLNGTTDPEKRDSEEQRDVQVMEGLLSLGGWLTIHPEGVLWYRGYNNWSDEEGAVQIEQLLERYDVEHIVVGHTPQLPAQIRARFDGSLYLADTGMLSSFYRGGRASMLEIRGDVFRAIYLDEGARLIEPTWTPRVGSVPSPFGPAARSPLTSIPAP